MKGANRAVDSEQNFRFQYGGRGAKSEQLRFSVDRAGAELRVGGQDYGNCHRVQVTGQLLSLEVKPLQSDRFFFP